MTGMRTGWPTPNERWLASPTGSKRSGSKSTPGWRGARSGSWHWIAPHVHDTWPNCWESSRRRHLFFAKDSAGAAPSAGPVLWAIHDMRAFERPAVNARMLPGQASRRTLQGTLRPRQPRSAVEGCPPGRATHRSQERPAWRATPTLRAGICLPGQAEAGRSRQAPFPADRQLPTRSIATGCPTPSTGERPRVCPPGQADPSPLVAKTIKEFSGVLFWGAATADLGGELSPPQNETRRPYLCLEAAVDG